MVKQLPSPSLETAFIFPWKRSTMVRQMACALYKSISFKEAFKNMGEYFSGHARSCVPHVDFHLSIIQQVASQGDRAFLGELHSIVYQVINHLPQACRVRIYRDVPLRQFQKHLHSFPHIHFLRLGYLGQDGTKRILPKHSSSTYPPRKTCNYRLWFSPRSSSRKPGWARR